MERAFSLFEVKEVREDQRIIEGIATTPTVDRMGDIVEPLGIRAAGSVPLLLHHDHTLPVGQVQFGAPTSKGLTFRAQIQKVDEPGIVKDRLDEAWASVKARLITAVSIGFRVLDNAIERIDTGRKFLRIEVVELSLVTIPAQADAIITQVRSVYPGPRLKLLPPPPKVSSDDGKFDMANFEKYYAAAKDWAKENCDAYDADVKNYRDHVKYTQGIHSRNLAMMKQLFAMSCLVQRESKDRIEELLGRIDRLEAQTKRYGT